MEIEIVCVIKEVSFLSSMFELFVIVVDDTNTISLAVSQISRKITSNQRWKEDFHKTEF